MLIHKRVLSEVRYKKLFLLIFIDLQLIFFSYLSAFVLRFDFNIPEEYFRVFIFTLPLVIFVKLVTYLAFRLNRIVWQYISLNDLFKIIRVSTFNNLAYGVILYLLTGFAGYPRSVVIIDWVFFIVALGGVRLFYRYSFEFQHKTGENSHTRALIIGAGDAAESLIRDMVTHKIKYRPVGILDDDPAKKNLYIHGVRILGAVREVYFHARALRVEEIIIAIPSATKREMEEIVRYCETCAELNVQYKTVPGINEILSGRQSPTAIREIKLEDLIDRQLVTVDQVGIRHEIKGKTVLITGAAGSIGSELARQVYDFQPDLLLLVDRNENNLMYLEKELERMFPNSAYRGIITDITNAAKMEKLIARYRPQYIFHAAAYKHVPYMEREPDEAIVNNVYATYSLAKIAEKHGIFKFVFISTDKAVRPTSVMGCSKRIAEIALLNLFKKSGTRFVIVRFGNVIGSQGSVVEIFQKQIKAGGPVTVTHEKMRRFFMTIPEAVRLTLQAGYIGDHRNILILDMGEQIPIVKVAENMIKLAGYVPYKEIPIKFTGIRPGEKMYEELWGNGEILVPTNHPKINRTFHNGQHDSFDLQSFNELLALSMQHNNRERLKTLMKTLVPDYQFHEDGAVIPEEIKKEAEALRVNNSLSGS
ncbi:MAG: nucleoside-diphosphate sugar epimerase/dehydratase [Calditrichia bacterium]